MKYYVLTFNEDFGDEINVPALACMNEVQFENWKVGSMIEEELTDELKSDIKFNQGISLQIKNKNKEEGERIRELSVNLINDKYNGQQPTYSFVSYKDRQLINKGELVDPNKEVNKYNVNLCKLKQKDILINQLIEDRKELYALKKTINTTSIMNAYLGNFDGDGYFEEDYRNYYTGQDFIDGNEVHVTEVNESFYNYFKKANLENLSLCNVFTRDW